MGSYAGAMGMPQFMPSSWTRYAVDFDADGKIDLQNSAADSIGSVANYLQTFNWQADMVTHYALHFDADRLDLDALLTNDVLPTMSVSQLQAKGVMVAPEALTHQGLTALIELQNGTAPPSYFVGTENFYVLTRYNWSAYYAMAVIELGRTVARAMKP
jgi:membrane-bound lytic murein transglycosylase B